MNGQWVSPTARTKRAVEIVPLPDVVAHQQVTETTLPSSFASRSRQGDLLFSWGKEHNFPQFCVQLPGRVHTIAAGAGAWRIVCYQCGSYLVEAALEQVVSYHPLAIENEAERVQREQLLEYGRAQDWQQFSFRTTAGGDPLSNYKFLLIIGPDEDAWQRFAVHGHYQQVCQACDLLALEGVVAQ